MKKMATLAIAGAVILGMAGCASPIASKDMAVNLKASATDDLIVGDSVTLTATRTLLHDRNDVVTLTLQSSPDGEAWTTIKKVSSTSKSKTLSAVVDTHTASDLTYRAVVRPTAEGAKASAVSDPLKLTIIDFKAMVRKFYYDHTIAFQTSTDAGLAWDTAHNYPGAFDTTSAVWAATIAQYKEAKVVDSAVPNLDTISPEPTWLLTATKCSAASTTPFPGRTFVVTIDENTVSNGFPSTNKADVHVTLLKGKLYDYIGYCQ
jgi:hypothetical protein